MLRNQIFILLIRAAMVGLVFMVGSHALADSPNVTKKTSLGTCYCMNPAFEQVIEDAISGLRGSLKKQKEAGKFIAYISIPLSNRGGGYVEVNRQVSEFVKKKLEKLFGPRFYALAPGTVEAKLANVDGKKAEGGEYMYMWTEVLAGAKGMAEDFDLVYFVGPNDFASFFKVRGSNVLGALEKYMNELARKDSEFKKIIDNEDGRRKFLRYYAFCASGVFSDGAHDEWNIFREANIRRRALKDGIGEQLPIYFEGRQVSLSEMESPVSRGYAVDCSKNCGK
jgi:hypothetical protein